MSQEVVWFDQNSRASLGGGVVNLEMVWPHFGQRVLWHGPLNAIRQSEHVHEATITECHVVLLPNPHHVSSRALA